MTDETKDRLVKLSDVKRALADHGIAWSAEVGDAIDVVNAIPPANPAQGDEGWVRVPREPTDEMLMCFGHEWITKQAKYCYAEMLAAAPIAAQAAGESAIEWPFIFTNTGGMEYVPRHHAEQRIAALATPPPSTVRSEVDVDALAQEIRKVDKCHPLSALTLAEELAPYIAALTADRGRG